jgi:calmodulin
MSAVDAYVACGGNADRSGVVSRDTLVRIIKEDFGLTINIEEV